MRKKRWFGIGLAFVVMLSLVIVGCAPEAAPPEEGAPTEEAPPEEAAPPAAPEAEVFHWKSSHWIPAGTFTYRRAEVLYDVIRENTGGRLDIELFPAGAIIPAYEGLKACQAGTVDVAPYCTQANVGTLGHGTYLTCNTTAGLNPMEFMMWYYEYGGDKWWDEMMENAGYTSFHMMWGMTGAEDFGYFNKKVTKASDLKGLKFRTAGVWGDILTKYFGASVINVPGGECYEAMKSGVVDAFEYFTPSNDFDLGFQEICKYMEIPGIHTTAVAQALTINEGKWNSLPDDIKNIVINACRQSTMDTYVEAEWLDSQAIDKFRDYGTEIVVLPEEFQKEIAYAAYDYYDKVAAEDAWFAEGLESQRYVHSVYEIGGSIRTPIIPSYEEYKASH